MHRRENAQNNLKVNISVFRQCCELLPELQLSLNIGFFVLIFLMLRFFYEA